MRIPTPKESQEQATVFEWAKIQSKSIPELELMYHVPNGGSRNKIEAARLKAQGVKAGVPDICLPVARNGCHGLYIELKRVGGAKPRENQLEWLEKLMRQGYKVAVCYGAEAAIKEITDYLKGE